MTEATGNYGNTRPNANLNEIVLTHAAVSSGTFQKLSALPVDGQISAQPLYVSGLPIPGRGPTNLKNVIFVATMNNSVYAIDGWPGADRSSLEGEPWNRRVIG